MTGARRWKPSLICSGVSCLQVVLIGSILMQSRTIPCYREGIQALKTLIPTFNPEEIMADWEDAEQTAFGLEFPNAQRNGCLFHSCKVSSYQLKGFTLMVPGQN